MAGEVARTFAAIEDDPTVYMTMNGPSEFHVIGTPQLVDHRPAGPDRGAGPADFRPARRGDPGDRPALCRPNLDVRWEMFENSSHMPHVEETERCLQVVGDFLDRNDR